MTGRFVTAAMNLVLQRLLLFSVYLCIGLKENSVFKMPDLNGNINFGECEMREEDNQLVKMESIPECTSHLFLFHKPSGKYSATKLSFCRTGETRKAILVVKQVVGPCLERMCYQPTASQRDHS